MKLFLFTIQLAVVKVIIFKVFIQLMIIFIKNIDHFRYR